MERVLITEVIRDRYDFFAALGRIHQCGRPAPANLDDMADFLRGLGVQSIIAARMEMDLADFAAVSEVLDDVGIALLR